MPEPKLHSLAEALKSENWNDAQYQARKGRIYVMRSIKVPGFYEGKVTSEVYPLHMACQYGAPLELMELLIQINAEALFIPDSKYKRLPLHLAVMNGAATKIIRFLLKKEPKAAAVPDALGRLPIHYSAKDKEHGEDNTRYLLRVYRNGTMQPDSNGFLPLHIACRCGMSLELIRMLIRVAPQAVFSKTKKGTTPRACAKQWGNDPHVLELLDRCQKEPVDLVDGMEALELGSVSGSSVSSFTSNLSGVMSSSIKGKFAGRVTTDFSELDDDTTLTSSWRD
jgi:hypothetical protein